jgi:uncharacterized membrane protein YeaQ/YmgE (transglycosylase-associated protein family)
MIAPVFRGFLIVVGFIASWFVTKDAPQFGIMEMAVALIQTVVIVALLAFWPERWSHFLNRVHKPPPSK